MELSWTGALTAFLFRFGKGYKAEYVCTPLRKRSGLLTAMGWSPVPFCAGF
jgi:hypothetical protein